MSCAEGRMMDVHFRVQYWTQWGQSLVLCGSTPQLGGWDVTRGRKMDCYHHEDSLIWEVTLSVAVPEEMMYRYAVMNEDGQVEKKETITRRLELTGESGERTEVLDTWQDRSSPYVVVASKSFRQAIGLHKTAVENIGILRQSAKVGHTIFRFVVRDLLCEDGQKIHVMGGIPQLGNWQQDDSLCLTERDSPTWEGEVLVPVNAFPFTYKFAVVDDKGVMLEKGESRLASLPLCSSSERTPSLVVIEAGHFRHPRMWRGAGIALPVFSLRTEASLGVGEFLDMKLLIDLCEAVGFQMIQVLPINDTTVNKMWWDSYPYSSLSVFALHPLYLSVEALSDKLPDSVLEKLETARTELDLESVDYEATLQVKLALAREVFLLEGEKIIESREFLQFFTMNKSWLKPYAVFLFLRDLFGTAEHWKWGELSSPTVETIERLSHPSQEFHRTILFVYYLQYQLHKQLVAVRKYAESKGVSLKGDLPIGVDKCSVDTWLAPSQFRMDKSTGAPPDFFDPQGQNWGFPTYNWEEMAKDGYFWWRKRLGKLSEYFHAYRIDHVLGFFRIWEIPDDCKHALLGCFRPSYPLTRQELESCGVWDIDRLCEPYVQWSHLEEMFGELAQEVSWKYFYKSSSEMYRFREEYNSEIKIMQIYPRKNSHWLISEITSIKNGLLRLFQNVLLIRHPKDKDAFYPRFDLKNTSSFAVLNPHWKSTLAKLHDDYYYHRHNELWRDHALKTLPVLIDSTDMLVCGEDLGMIPSCVHPVMEELGLLGMRIQRMPSEEGKKFGDPSNYPYLTVCSPSCHDVLTLRGWWEEDGNRTEEFYHEVLGGKGKAPKQCTTEVMKAVIQQHMDSPSALAIIPIQDLFALSEEYNGRPAEEETINNPRNPRHYWRYRMHVTVETLLADSELQGELIGIMKKACRGGKFWRGRHGWTKPTNGNSRVVNSKMSARAEEKISSS